MEDDILKQHPEIFAFVQIVNGKVSLVYDEDKTSIEDVMVVLNQMTGEYMKAIADQAVNNKG